MIAVQIGVRVGVAELLESMGMDAIISGVKDGVIDNVLVGTGEVSCVIVWFVIRGDWLFRFGSIVFGVERGEIGDWIMLGVPGLEGV